MFTKKTTVKIKKDKNFIKYIKIIRQYDSSLSVEQIKTSIDKNDVVFAFDPNDNHLIANGKNNSCCFLEEYFIKTLKNLKNAGANMIVMEGEKEIIEYTKVLSDEENISRLVEQLFDAKDGTSAYAAIDKLKKIALKSEEKRHSIVEILMKYSNETSIDHLKALIITDINNIVKENEYQYSDFYVSKIESGDFLATYYAIEGYSKIMQKMSYEYLVKKLLSEKLDIECNALIVSKLSQLSNNPFDQGNPWEKREWKKSNLKIDEISAWKDAGYPDGNGYEDPIVHPCLANPNSSEEMVYSILDNKLAKKREKNTDMAHPTNWLIQGNIDDIELIKKKLIVPNDYLEFLMKASPLNVEMKLKGYGPISLYGAHELVEMQIGYSFNPIENKKLEEWPENYVVIATCYADPVCIDGSLTNSPIYYAMHNMGKWEFEEIYSTLLDFLKALE